MLKAVSSALEGFADQQNIPAYGFGDARCEGFNVFSLFENDMPASGFKALLHRYRQVVPHVRMAGPTSFAPIIQQVA